MLYFKAYDRPGDAYVIEWTSCSLEQMGQMTLWVEANCASACYTAWDDGIYYILLGSDKVWITLGQRQEAVNFLLAWGGELRDDPLPNSYIDIKGAKFL